jgi:hypothetical protein
MNYAVEMASGDMMYMPSFIKISSGVRWLLRWTRTHGGYFVRLLKFFKIKTIFRLYLGKVSVSAVLITKLHVYLYCGSKVIHQNSFRVMNHKRIVKDVAFDAFTAGYSPLRCESA